MEKLYPGEINSPATTLSEAYTTGDDHLHLSELPRGPTAPNTVTVGSDETAVTFLYTGKSAASGAGTLTGVSVLQGTDKNWDAGTIVSRTFTAYDWDSARVNLEDVYLIPAGTAGEDLVPYALVYLKGADGKWWKTDSDAEATTTGLLGIWLDTTSADATGRVQVLGQVTNGSWSFSAGDILYVSATPGSIATSAGTNSRKIGFAVSATKIMFIPEDSIPGSGAGDVIGPASSADNTISRFDGTNNKTIQGSLVTIDDSGSINIPLGQSYKVNGTALAASDVGALASGTKLDDLGAPDDNTDLDASTSKHGLLLKAVAPASGLRNVVGIDNAETAYTNKALFDATDPAMNGSASPGSAMTAARRDHVHASDTSRAAASHSHAATDITSDTLDGDRLPAISTTKKGGVPATGSPSGKFLKDDGTWGTPAGSGDVVGPALSIDNFYALFSGVTGKLLKQAALYDVSGGVSLPPGSKYKINGVDLAYSDVGAAPVNPLATDSLWDAAGDLVIGSGANTAAKLSKGGAYQVLRMKSDASTVEWGAPVVRLAAVTGSITFNTTSNDDGVLLTAVDLGANAGVITRIRLWANQTLGQRTAGAFLINDGDGISPTDTSLAYDGLVGTLPTAGNEGTGDYVWIDNELCRVSAGTSTPLTLVRGLCGTLAAFHDDNAIVRTANEGLKLKLFSANAESEANQIFELTRILTGTFTTDAAISAGDKVLTLSSSPTVLSDWGRGDPFIIDDTADEINYVQALYGSVSGTTYDDSIVPQNTLAAHDTAKTVYRVVEYNRPIPFKLAGTATNLYVSLQAEQLLPGNATVYYEFLIEKWG